MRDLIPFGNHPLYRWTLGWLGAPTTAFVKLCTNERARRLSAYRQAFQESILPLSHLDDAIGVFHELYRCYPLIVYPLRIVDHGANTGLLYEPQVAPGTNYELYILVGVYGIPKAVELGEAWDAVASNRALEGFSRNCRDYSNTYVDLFMTQEEFETMFNHVPYYKARKKYHADGAFPIIYNKVGPHFPGAKLLFESRNTEPNTSTP